MNNPLDAKGSGPLYLALGGASNIERVRLVLDDISTSPTMDIGVLVSYYFFKEEDLDAMMLKLPKGTKVFADSGAFSAASIGANVTAHEYKAWLRRWGHCITLAATPDVIGDHVSSTREAEDMLGESWPFTSLPVFHVGSPWEALTHWIGKVDYLALGGMVPLASSTRTVTAWARKCFRLLPESMRVHGFGATGVDIVRAVPWTSVDSSSWAAPYMYARLMLFDPRCGAVYPIDIRDKPKLLAMAPLLREFYDSSPERIFTTLMCPTLTRAERVHLASVSVRSYYNMWKFMQARWRSKEWKIDRATP